jgi:dipeptidyl aminopeptidase/acylaminoacyl peptidase
VMSGDLRGTPLYQEAENAYRALRQPGTGQITDAAEIHASPDGRFAVFTGTLMDTLESTPFTRICLTELETGRTHVATFGPRTDRLPKYSPEGQHIAFLSDRHQAGDFQLYLLNPRSGAVRRTARVSGWVEYLHWSPDGSRLLLGVAGHGADLSAGQGATTSRRIDESVPSWMPTVDTGIEASHWRSAWIYDLGTDCARRVPAETTNIWEASWCGNDAIVATASPDPSEGLWYTARLHVIDVATGNSREIHAPRDQLGILAASPSGKYLSFVEAICSDRWIVAGELHLLDARNGRARRIDTADIDVTCVEWRSEQTVLVAGHREFATVVGLYDVSLDKFTELWASREITTGGFYVAVSGLNARGDCVLIGESTVRAPEIATIRSGKYRSLRSFDVGQADRIRSLVEPKPITWAAPDGLPIQGWLLEPRRSGPHPLIMNIHGGPVWQWRPVWLGRRGAWMLMLLERGYAIFLPNPRGSAGRGKQFVRPVVGDMGGKDTQDFLSAIDHLIERGIADQARLGVMGGSYGGFMTVWLVTQDGRFSAAIAASPVTNYVTAHLISNHARFYELFLDDTYVNPCGKYFERSPIMHAHKVKTPTLNVCGALDRCTPPEEAVQFHNALLQNGTRSVLVIYPQEGHGVLGFPAAIDYTARVVGWFVEHIPPDNEEELA